ncbi:hypothetical protein ARAF_2031 [Arsenophonus endosymbiont of Aleurodicus floccissimus]|uniref:type VI secretion system baseplate subunit TssG n=1 Tax=Arsenophonus endosymbiont of Aleurodicus floccissimus TaxID=2152761 RepID=UPI000E6AE84A|nr:type VI secretion system baseplate subunit TssG [Arsenophonus endosymbiont of Aleurodicus floccissimus]SPP32138.1 hypothetical protein ARAF_2031 [Arsenophonus endosymbiont of Aleurodicus floccissimus]
MAMTFSLLGGSFYQNARRLLRKGFRKGRQVSVPDDVVRFESVLTLDAPEREVESFTVDERTAEATTYCMAVNHFGLLGTHGALPLRYTEWLIDRRYRYNDDSAKAFLDVFNHRLLSLRFQRLAEVSIICQCLIKYPAAATCSDYCGDRSISRRSHRLTGS